MTDGLGAVPLVGVVMVQAVEPHSCMEPHYATVQCGSLGSLGAIEQIIQRQIHTLLLVGQRAVGHTTSQNRNDMKDRAR